MKALLKELHGWSHRLHLHAGWVWNLLCVLLYVAAFLLQHYHRRCHCFTIICIWPSFRFFFFFFFFHPLKQWVSPLLLPSATSSFNSTITQRSTISARASAGRIRVTWAPPDCNQSENNESRTKTSAITLAWLNISRSRFCVFFSLPLLFSVSFSSLKVQRKTI